ncbi:MAG: alanine/glycine:cation symporter family protein [Jaaginema sp. PMC 1079.18]|nr:alanine/glycine:cation symporter family protein [Jaaginema sp. PMC 1080.18]MEC4850285.1 alanine/glycine:cation symporter family protein [Jaaginema sp. PMC 1079.18]MEC4867392.1 alanine/glycine:cation symporter family protein [Jaaginema sp. PMC 1078.18]
MTSLNTYFSQLVSALHHLVFWEIGGIPLTIAWIAIAGIIFTFKLRLINIWGFPHAIAVLLGKYDHNDHPGDVSHFQAMATALSATVGLGNIAGVAIAIDLGGLGAVFWMTVVGFLGMSTKLIECTLGQKYRQIDPKGAIAGGPMYYLSNGLAELGQPRLGRFLAGSFALLCVGSSLGAGNMFQANQSLAALEIVFADLSPWRGIYGLGLAFLVGLVIIGGIRRISTVAGSLVPIMLTIYIGLCLWVIGQHATAIPTALATILHDSVQPQAIEGGIVGVIVQGVRRSVFSNAAGTGSAAIAHAAAQSPEPARQGIVALLEPFIDTVIICNLTALAIATSQVTGQHLNGIELTAQAFGNTVSWFPAVLALVVLLFAFSTIVSWSYYGEQCWTYLFGHQTTLLFKLLFLTALGIGAIVNLDSVVDFSDTMLVLMAIPNLWGCYCLCDRAIAEINTYFAQLGEGGEGEEIGIVTDNQ